MKRFLSRFPFWHEAALVLLLGVVLITAGVLSPDFLAPETQTELLTHVWEAALVALPMTLIIITGGIDLSVGSTMALSAVTLGLAHKAGWPIAAGVVLALVVGAAAGALNGFFITRIKVHPLLVTLATLAAYRGIAEGISKAEPISGFPDAFTHLSIAGPLFVVAAVVAGLALWRTNAGLSLYAIGHNETAVRFSGIDADRIKATLYTLAGLAAATAAVLFVARRNTAKADIGTGLELEVITMVVLGGTSIFGGRGRIAGTVLGILLLHEVREFVGWQWHRDELNLIVIGVLLIASVLLNRLLTKKGKNDA